MIRYYQMERIPSSSVRNRAAFLPWLKPGDSCRSPLNSWIAGKRQTAGDLQAILTEVDKQSAALGAVVAAAAKPPSPVDAEDDEAVAVAPATEPAAATAARPREWRSVAPGLRERRYGKSILAGQVAAMGIIAASVMAWMLRRRRLP
jgi:hypothetical protein